VVNRDEQYKKPHAHLYVLIIVDMQAAVLAIMAENVAFSITAGVQRQLRVVGEYSNYSNSSFSFNIIFIVIIYCLSRLRIRLTVGYLPCGMTAQNMCKLTTW